MTEVISDQLPVIRKIRSYRDLEIWQEAHKLVIEVYRITGKFPSSELFGLTSQLRRASVSVAACIVEGHCRNTTKEFIKFLYDSRASAAECGYRLLVARDLGYVNVDIYEKITDRYNVLEKRINSLISKLAIFRK